MSLASTISERAILAHIVQEPNWTLRNANRLSPAMFDSEHHRIIFEAVTECGDQWDLLKLTAIMRARGTLEKAGGPALVSDLFVTFTGPQSLEWHLQQVRASTVLRRAKGVAEDAVRQIEAALNAGVEDAAELVAKVMSEFEVAGRLPGKRLKRMTMGDATSKLLDDIEERAKNPGGIPGWTTGFPAIDKNSLGMQPGHVWIFCGGPGDGKSTLMQNCAEGALAAGARLGIYQLEMPIEEQAFRFLASAAEVDNGNLWTGSITNAEADAVRHAVKKLGKMGAELMNTDDVTASDILADIEAADYDVVMVDYLQLLDEQQAKGESREMVVARISRRLKRVAKKKGITILSGSQLNDDGKLRESRAIGQDADKVIRISKVFSDAKEEQDDKRTLEFLKNRGGKRNVRVPMNFHGQFYRFYEGQF